MNQGEQQPPDPSRMAGRSCRARGLTSVQQQERWGTVHWAAEAPHTSSSPPPPCPGTAETQRGSPEHLTKPQAQPTSPGVRFQGRDNQLWSLNAPRVSCVKALTPSVPVGNLKPQEWGKRTTKNRHRAALDFPESSSGSIQQWNEGLMGGHSWPHVLRAWRIQLQRKFEHLMVSLSRIFLK